MANDELPTNSHKRPYVERREQAFRATKFPPERAITGEGRVYFGGTSFTTQEARRLAEDMQAQGFHEYAAGLIEKAKKIEAGEPDEWTRPKTDPNYVCDMPCCNEPPPDDDKPFIRVNWAEFGYTPAEAAAILMKDPTAMPKPRMARTWLPGDDV